MKKAKILRFPLTRIRHQSSWPPEPPTPVRMPVPLTWRLTLAVRRAA